MKFKRITYCLFLLWLFACPGKAQKPLCQKIEISDTLIGFYPSLKYIERKTGLQFHFSNIVEYRNEKAFFPGEYTVKQILDSLVNNTTVSYIEIGNSVVLSPINKNNRYEIYGTIHTQKGAHPVPFANIYIQNSSVGTVSNYNGSFRLIVPENLWGDTLVISALGYTLQNISINRYITDSLTVQLEQQRIPIRYVLVRPTDARQIVKNAYQKRSNNYSTNDEYFYGFFRESNKQDEEYIAVNEAVVNIIKKSFSAAKNDLISIKKGRKGEKTNPSKFVNLIVQGGLYNSLRLDIIKNNAPFFNEDAQDLYKYAMVKNTIYKGRSTYIIGFEPKRQTEESTYTGRFYIDMETLGISKVEFELNSLGIQLAKYVLVKKIPKGMKVSPLHASYQIDYRFYNDKWHFSNAHSEIKIRVKSEKRSKEKRFNSYFTSNASLVVTGESSSAFPKQMKKTAADMNDIFVEQIDNLDTKFWEGNNIILPEEAMLQTLKKLQMQGIIGSEHNFISAEDSDKSNQQ